MNKNTFIASFSTGSLLDIAGIFNPLGIISQSDLLQIAYNLIGLLVSGFMAAFGAWIFSLIRQKWLSKNQTNAKKS